MFKRLLPILLALVALPAHADWVTATDTLSDNYAVTKIKHEWVGAAVDSTGLDFSVCQDNKSRLQARFDPSVYDASVNATVRLLECKASNSPYGECGVLALAGGTFSETEWTDVRSAQGNYLTRPYIVADALTGTTLGDLAVVEVRCLVPSTSLHSTAQPSGTTNAVSGQGSVVTDWNYGAYGAMSRFAERLMAYSWEFDVNGQGRRTFYPVTTTYTVGTLPAAGCDAANEVGTFAWTSDGGAYECMVTDGGAGARAWVQSMNPPYMWLTSATGGATGGPWSFVDSSQAHIPGPFLYGWEDSVNGCQQAHYLGGGGGRGFPLWGRLSMTDTMLIALGYTDPGNTRALVGWTRTPTGIALNPAAASAAAATQNFTDGFGYIVWEEGVYGFGRRINAATVSQVPNMTMAGTFLAGPPRGMVTLRSDIAVIAPASNGTWNARFSAKVGFPFLMRGHPLSDPVSTDWNSVTLTAGQPDWSNVAGEDLRLTLTVCSANGGQGEMKLMRGGLGAFIYDYD